MLGPVLRLLRDVPATVSGTSLAQGAWGLHLATKNVIAASDHARLRLFLFLVVHGISFTHEIS